MKNALFFPLSVTGIMTLSSCGHTSGMKPSLNTTKTPNLIFIYSDDLGYGDLSCYGATSISTPNIDKLAAEGQRFVNAYATSATSTPSRFGMLTGKYPWRQKNTGIAPGNSELIIDTTTVTLANVMQQSGYTTAAIGKWHLGLGAKGGTDFNKKIYPNTKSIGFDYEFVIPATVDRVPCVFVENGYVSGLDPEDPIFVDYEKKIGDLPTGEENPELVRLKPSQGHNNTIINGIPRIGWMTGGKSALWIDENIADTITDRAKQFICKNAKKPFFLYMGTQDVHVPRVPHPRFAGKSSMGDRGDVILQLDWTIGEIMKTLDSLNITDNTIFIFTSDNGAVIDDGYQDRALELLGTHKPSGISRGAKYSLYEGGTKIPFIIRWPEKIKPGIQEALFSQINVFASMSNLLNIDLNNGIAPDSKNQITDMLGETTTGTDYIIQQNLDNTLSIICDGWKYIEPSDKPDIEFWTKTELGHSPDGMLFRINEDPSETINLINTHKEKAIELSAMLNDIKRGY